MVTCCCGLCMGPMTKEVSGKTQPRCYPSKLIYIVGDWRSNYLRKKITRQLLFGLMGVLFAIEFGQHKYIVNRAAYITLYDFGFHCLCERNFEAIVDITTDDPIFPSMKLRRPVM